MNVFLLTTVKFKNLYRLTVDYILASSQNVLSLVDFSLQGGARHIREIYAFGTFLVNIFFIVTSTGQTAQQISTLDGLNDTDWPN
jgi:hypothetical protein